MTAEPSLRGDAQPERFSLKGGLAAYRWAAADDGGVERPLVIVHGFAEHARRHEELAEAAGSAGHPVYGLDLPGHGESPGPRAVIDGHGEALVAVGELVARANQESGAAAPVLFGHSMGGAIALRFALEQPERLSGLVLSSPFLVDALDRPAWLLAVARLAARLAPRMVVTKVDLNSLSRDQAEVQRYVDDPMVITTGVPAVTGRTITDGGAETLAQAHRLTVPTLVLHGSADGIAGVAGSRRLVAEAPPGIAELVEIEGGFHELFHDEIASGAPAEATRAVLDFLSRA